MPKGNPQWIKGTHVTGQGRPKNTEPSVRLGVYASKRLLVLAQHFNVNVSHVMREALIKHVDELVASAERHDWIKEARGGIIT